MRYSKHQFSEIYNEIHACINYFWKKREKYSMIPRTKSNEIKCIENTSPKHRKEWFHMNKMDKNIDYSIFVQSNNQNQYWHERLLLL